MARAALRRAEASDTAQGFQELSAGTAPRSALPQWLRLAMYALAALLWGSGAAWLLLHHGFQQRSDFGPLPNAWEAPLMRLHGLIAVCGVFLIGWMTAAHVVVRWSSERNRRSGLWLAATVLLLICSGYALYYTTGVPHDGAALIHEAVGLLSPCAALAHCWRNRSRG